MLHVMFAVLAAAAPGVTPIRDSVDRITTDVAMRTGDGEQVGKVAGFEGGGVRKPRQESFFGPVNLLTGASLGLGAWYDVKTTMDGRALLGANPRPVPPGTIMQDGTPAPPGSFRGDRMFIGSDGVARYVVLHEKSEFYRASVIDNNRRAMWRQKTFVNAPVWVGSHFLRRSRHVPLKVVGWALPVVWTGLQVKAGIDNQREIDRINAQLR
jgi:hypothetical protein